MGHDVYEQHEQARQVFTRADETLGFALSELIFQGPEEQLRQTINTQPALLATSIALWEVFREKSGIIPDYVAGHSLGEYSALVAAGALTFEDAVSTVRTRGQLMEQAVPDGQGAMAAVLGADRSALASLCEQITAEIGLVQLANMNCPGQIVVSGSAEGVTAVEERGKEIGARRIIRLEVSGPFHSTLMAPAAERLGERLAQLTIKPPAVPVIANVTAEPVSDVEAIRDLLQQQVVSPVLWEDSVRWLIDTGVQTFFEIGSGQVLAGLIKKIDRQVTVFSIDSLAAIKEDYDVK